MRPFHFLFFFLFLGTQNWAQIPHWLGGVDDNSAKIKAFPSSEQAKQEAVWEILDPASGKIRRIRLRLRKIGSHSIWSAHATELDENRLYLYRLLVKGQDTTYTGNFRTFSQRPISFRFALSSCSFRPGSPAYIPIMEFKPSLFLHLGDLHYENIETNRIEDHIKPYLDRFLLGKKEQALCLQVPMAYIWDDHDYCGNNSSGPSACGDAARAAYLSAFPAYEPYRMGAGLAHSFQQGSVRFIVLDLRSERRDSNIMSAEQMQWFKAELLKSHQSHLLSVVLSSVSWYGNEQDNWGGFPKQRQEILDFVNEQGIEKLVWMCGDAHMNALDDGRNETYPLKKAPQIPFPVIQAGSLLSFGSHKGGSYSHGDFVNPLGAGQWVECQAIDNGEGALALAVEGKQMMAGFLEPKTIFQETFFWSIPHTKTVSAKFDVDSSKGVFQVKISNPDRQSGTIYRLRTGNGSILDAAATGSSDQLLLSTANSSGIGPLFLEEEHGDYKRVYGLKSAP